MPKVTFNWPSKVPRSQYSAEFIQKMLNRVASGFFRYGSQTRTQGEPKQWIKRARLELKAYEKTGNAEHLVNVSNYMMCEWISPEHPKHHFKHETISATRGRL